MSSPSPPPEKKKRAAVYLRISTLRGGSQTEENQRRQLHEFIEKEGRSVGPRSSMSTHVHAVVREPTTKYTIVYENGPHGDVSMTKTDQVLDAVREQGLVRPRDLEARGLPPRLLRRLAGRGDLERVGHGLYRHPEAPLTEHHSLALVSKRYPEARVCLLSALQFHEMTTQWPRAVWVALRAGAWEPEASPTKLQVVRTSGPALTEGTEEHVLEGVPVKVYGPAKTVADCFKFRSRVGLDVALEALRSYLRERDGSVDDLFRYAEICRVQGVMRPYVEAMMA